jgi:hypothetical protein
MWIQIYTYRSTNWSMILQSSLLLFYITSIFRWFESHQVILWFYFLSSWSYNLINLAFIDRFSQFSWKSRYLRNLRISYSRIVNDSLNLIQRTRQVALWQKVRFVNSKYSKSNYAQLAWIEEKWSKILEFHVAFMIELMKFERSENQIDVQIDLKNETFISANRIHISTLLSSSTHWRVMLRHSHDEEFKKATQMKFDAINSRDTWEIMNKSIVNQKIMSLKWIVIYKNDSNNYFIKYKARIIMKDDLQDADSQNVYAVTLTLKIFRMLMTLIAAFHLKTRQLDVVNAFLNAHNDEFVYCQMFDNYRLDDKCYKIIRALYDQRKSLLL